MSYISPPSLPHIYFNVSEIRIHLKRDGVFHLIKDNNSNQHTAWHTVNVQLMACQCYQYYLVLPIMGDIPTGTAPRPGAQMGSLWEGELVTTLSRRTPSLCQEVNCHLSTPPHFIALITTLLGRKGRTRGCKKGGITI